MTFYKWSFWFECFSYMCCYTRETVANFWPTANVALVQTSGLYSIIQFLTSCKACTMMATSWLVAFLFWFHHCTLLLYLCTYTHSMLIQNHVVWCWQVIFTNESNIERWKNKRQQAVDSKVGRLDNFIECVKVPIQVFCEPIFSLIFVLKCVYYVSDRSFHIINHNNKSCSLLCFCFPAGFHCVWYRERKRHARWSVSQTKFRNVVVDGRAFQFWNCHRYGPVIILFPILFPESPFWID